MVLMSGRFIVFEDDDRSVKVSTYLVFLKSCSRVRFFLPSKLQGRTLLIVP